MSLSDQSERPRLLVVDDDPTVRLLAQSVLAAAGFAVTDVADGASAIEDFARQPPDIVLLDVLMPGMDGFQVCTELRRAPGGQHTPMMMLTGLDDVESINRAYEAGATEFVTKPINWLLLSYRLRYMLRASRALADRRRSEATKEALLGAIPDIVLHLRSDGVLLNYKTARNSTPGKAPAAAVGLHLEHAFPVQIASRYLEMVQAALQQNSTQVFEYVEGSGEATREYEARLCPSGEGEVLSLGYCQVNA